MAAAKVFDKEKETLESQLKALQNRGKLKRISLYNRHTESYLVDKDHLEVNKKKLLGKGSFGKVYYGSYFKSPVAIKKFKEVTLSDEFWADFDNETKILM